jgi:hypothetical protein
MYQRCYQYDHFILKPHFLTRYYNRQTPNANAIANADANANNNNNHTTTIQ